MPGHSVSQLSFPSYQASFLILWTPSGTPFTALMRIEARAVGLPMNWRRSWLLLALSIHWFATACSGTDRPRLTHRTGTLGFEPCAAKACLPKAVCYIGAAVDYFPD
jgi:hypothetical protein